MKKILTLTVFVVFALTGAMVFAGGQQEESGAGDGEISKGLTVAYAVSTLDNGYHQADSAWATKYALEKYGAKVQVFDGKADNNVMAENCDLILASGYDMASLHVWEGDTIEPIVAECIKNGTATSSFYERVGNVKMPFVAISEKEAAFEMGKIAATQWMKAYPDKPVVYAVIGWMENEVVQVERTDPFVAGVKSVASNAVEAAMLDASAGTEKAYQVCQDLLQAHPEVNIIYSEASDLTLGVQPALEEAGRGKAVNGVPLTEILVSTDASENELRDIYDPNSSLKITMGLTPKDNAIARIDTCMKIYTGEIPQNEVVVVTTHDKVIDFWGTTAKEAAAWFNEQYDGTLSLE